jgi:predicted nucleotidyltransferase
MMTKDQLLAFLAQNRIIFRDKFHIVRIGIFGSYAREEQGPNSDIDLMVEFEENTPDLYDLKLQLKEFFQNQMGVDVDICREKYIKPRFKNSILKETVYAY